MDYSVVNNGKKFGVEDKNGNLVIPIIYDEIRECSDIRHKYDSNKVLVSFKGDALFLFAIRKGRLFALTNEQHELLTPFKYKEIHNFGNGITSVVVDKKSGIIDHTGKELTTMDYDRFWNKHLPIFCAIKNKLFGYLDRQGNVVIPIIHERMGILFSDGLCAVFKNKKMGFMDEKGNLVIPYMYDGMSHFENGFACVKYNKEFGLIDKQNNIVIPFMKYEIFKDIDKVFKEHKRFSLSHVTQLLSDGAMLEAEGFLKTILHHISQNQLQVVEIDRHEIQRASEALDAKHKLAKKITVLLQDLENAIPV